MIWKCEDCNRMGFYYGETVEEIRKRHANECDRKVGGYVAYVSFSSIPAHWHKRQWVPNWLWNLFAEKLLDEVKKVN